MRCAAVRWVRTLDEDAGGTAAWLVSLAERSLQFPPTARDLQDVGPRRGEDASRFLHRRGILRDLLGRRCGVRPTQIEIGYDAVGRPLILNPNVALSCSVSARGDLAAFALSPCSVGIDIEPLEPGDIPWAAFAPDEAAGIRALPASDRLGAALRLWTIKEAYLKARGSGLLVDPVAIVIAGSGLQVAGSAIPFDGSVEHRVTLGGRLIMAACVALAPDSAVAGGDERLRQAHGT